MLETFAAESMVVAPLIPRPVSDTWTSIASPPLYVHIVGEFNLALRMPWPRAGEPCKPSIVVVVEEGHGGVLYRPQLPAHVRQSPSPKCVAVILLSLLYSSSPSFDATS
jgi:hypothetical protein